MNAILSGFATLVSCGIVMFLGVCAVRAAFGEYSILLYCVLGFALLLRVMRWVNAS